jgi:hypothetical protein
MKASCGKTRGRLKEYVRKLAARRPGNPTEEELRKFVKAVRTKVSNEDCFDDGSDSRLRE